MSYSTPEHTDKHTDLKHYDVVIAGGSFIGLALASALSLCSDHTLQCLVVDPVSADHQNTSRFDGRASALSLGSKHLLEVLGVWSEIAGDAQPVHRMEITDSALENVLRPVFLQFDTDYGPEGPATYIVENSVLRAGLNTVIADDPGVILSPPCAVETFEHNGHCLRLWLSDGRQCTTNLLIAADGRRSKLRKKAGIKTIGWSYDQVGLVSTVSHALPHNGHAVQHFLPSGPFARLPLTGNRCSLVWSEKKRIAERLIGLNDDDFIAEVQKRFGHDLGDLTLAGPRSHFPLSLHLARHYVTDRFALVGDAAHGVHPIAGLGLNIGLRDVAALCEVVLDAKKLGLDFGSEAILQRYVQWRRLDNMTSAFVMDGLNRLFSNDFMPLRTLRDIGLGLVQRSPMLKDFFMKEAAGLSGSLPRLLKGERV
ncbi:MAG: FAD-dependent monooxygenase [Pseudomonadota bacterium]